MKLSLASLATVALLIGLWGCQSEVEESTQSPPTLLTGAPNASSVEMTERDIQTFRWDNAIPDSEYSMSIDELFAALGSERWALDAIELRCLLVDDQTRKTLYGMMASYVIEGDAALSRKSENTYTWIDVIQVIGRQDEHRDEAVSTMLTLLDAVQNPRVKMFCFEPLGNLGGPAAIEYLKRATISELSFPRLGSYYYSPLYKGLSSCGPDAAQALIKIDKALGARQRMWRYRAFNGAANEEVYAYLLGKHRKAKSAGDIRHQALLMTTIAGLANKFTGETRQEIFDLVIGHAQDPEHLIRAAVAKCLGMIGDASHLPLLKSMQEDTESVAGISLQPRPGSSNPTSAIQVPTETFPVREAATLAIENLQ